MEDTSNERLSDQICHQAERASVKDAVCFSMATYPYPLSKDPPKIQPHTQEKKPKNVSLSLSLMDAPGSSMLGQTGRSGRAWRVS